MARIKEDPNELTPTESRLWAVLQDGKPHPLDELVKVIDEYAGEATLRMHMSNIRTKMLAVGTTMPVCRNGAYQRAVLA